MIASVIGKTFLKEYNRRSDSNYSAEEFFLKIFHPVFYGHERYLQWMTNTPFTTGLKKGELPDDSKRNERLQTFQEKFDTQDFPNYSYAIGFPAVGDLGTTSGQVTNLNPVISHEEIYATWIGGGLGIRVQGGMSLLFNHPQILWKVYEGWSLYRQFLEEYDNLRPNQIDTWNGQWFSYACSKEFNAASPETGMSKALEPAIGGGIQFKTQQWTEVIFGIAQQFREKQITGYVFSLGQMNTTIGFIPFELPDIARPLQFYSELFGENDFLDSTTKITQMYGTAHSFRSACQKGVIGTPALEPKDLVQYMQSRRGTAKTPDFAKADREKEITFKVYQTWLLAMLNNKELWDYANNAAKAYLEYVEGSKKASRQRTNAIDQILDATNKRAFIEANIEVVENAAETAQKISDIVEQIHLMPEDNFRYFKTLIKFRYAFWKNQQQGENQ
jgi:hypothetical protein